MKIKAFFRVQFLLGLSLCLAGGLSLGAESTEKVPAAAAPPSLQIAATMCEGVGDSQPITPTVLFRVGNKCAYCWSTVDAVKEKSVIYHHWYRRDRLVSSIKLSIQPPRWSTYSSIYLRESDKGPWRVDIVDSGDKILKTLRFSITD